MRCPNCGNENPPDYVFCDECGARLQGGEDPGVAAQPVAATDTGANLGQTADAGPGAGGTGGVGGVAPVGSYGGQPQEGQQGYGADAAYASPQGGQYDGGQAGGQYGTGTGGSGPMGDPGTQGGQSPYDVQGSAGATGVADGAGASGAGLDQQATQATYGEDKGFGAGPSATPAAGVGSGYTGDEGSGAGTPVTEDTMQAGGATGQGWQPSADDVVVYAPATQAGTDQGASMPGVVEIDDDGQNGQGAAGLAPVPSGETYSDTGAGTGAVGAAVGGVSGGAAAQEGGQGQGAWASQALTLLDRAQAAMGRGDWAAFGSGMSELRSYLTGLGATTGTAGTGPAAWTASSSGSYDAPAADSTATAGQNAQGAAGAAGAVGQHGGGAFTSSDTATDQGGTYGGYNEPTYSGSGSQADASGTPAVEPQAEAGTLDAQASAGDESGYDAPYGGTGEADANAGMAAGDVTTGPTAGAGVGMMSQGASQAAVGGIAASTNGASDNMMARLVIISTGAELPIPDQEEIMVGREDPSSGIFPDVDLTPYGGEEGGVSRRHARLLHINDDYFVEDLQSTNFTKLDGQRLPAHVRERLEDGARIDFGRVATIFRRS
ncbi:MAG TPA: FHA domain-containing protein [Chloroflexia bacterium]|nr:FHA domain-containing protein [Chloroflexia bacterium]